MSTTNYCQVYAEQLALEGHGTALWDPSPVIGAGDESYDFIHIGDVGWIDSGKFRLLFRAAEPLGNRIPGQHVPEKFEPLDCGNDVQLTDLPPYRITAGSSSTVGASAGVAASVPAVTTIDMGSSLGFESSQSRCAILLTERPIFRKVAGKGGNCERYIRKHYPSWQRFASDRGYGDIDLLLVTGTEMTRDFAALVHASSSQRLQARFNPVSSIGGSAHVAVWGQWSHYGSAHTICGPTNVVQQGHYDQCVFLKAWRRRSRIFPRFTMKAAAEPEDLSKHLDDDNLSEADRMDTLKSEQDDDDTFEQDVQQQKDHLGSIAEYIFKNSNANDALVHDDHCIAIVNAVDPQSRNSLDNALFHINPKVDVDEDGVAQICFLPMSFEGYLVDNPSINLEELEMPNSAVDAFDTAPLSDGGVRTITHGSPRFMAATTALNETDGPQGSVPFLDDAVAALPSPIPDNFSSMLAKIAGTPALADLADLVRRMASDVKNIKVYRHRFAYLYYRSAKLVLALRKSASEMGSMDTLGHTANEVKSMLLGVHQQTQIWSATSRVDSFAKLDLIKKDLDASHNAIDAFALQFNVSSKINPAQHQKELATIEEQDQADLLQALLDIVQDQEELKLVAQMGTPETENFVRKFREKFGFMFNISSHKASSGDQTRRHALQAGLLKPVQVISPLPPAIDLTDQVVDVSQYPAICSAENDIYTGSLLGVKVALKCSRERNNGSKLFLEETKTWRRLRHPNIIGPYGAAYLWGRPTVVCEWMSNSNAFTYVINKPSTCRLKILSEVALGMEYLHANDVVHGALRGQNVLISRSGSARISDFYHSRPPIMGMRWWSPELINAWLQPVEEEEEYYRRGTSAELPVFRTTVGSALSPPTDVWSFGMLCLELMTSKPPFHMQMDVRAVMSIGTGHLPKRPSDVGISDGLWDIMQRCWAKEPGARPSMADIAAELQGLRKLTDQV